jgi:hypothetical protein
MRLLAAAGAVAAAALTSPAAHADPMPTGRISGQAGLKAGTGGFASRMGLGAAVGVEAAYQPLRPDRSLGWGLSWSATWGYYGDAARIAGSLWTLELLAGARVRVPLGVRRRQVLFLGGGGGLLRLNEPPVDGGERSYLGPWAAAGVEGLLFGELQVGLEARYVAAGADEGTIGLLLSFGFGR